MSKNVVIKDVYPFVKVYGYIFRILKIISMKERGGKICWSGLNYY